MRRQWWRRQQLLFSRLTPASKQGGDMDIITDNLAQSLVIFGLLLLAIEILMLGFATFILFFIGVASVITGILVGIGIIDHNLVDALLAVGVLSAVTAA